jgi:Fe-S cluster assembly protein SufD
LNHARLQRNSVGFHFGYGSADVEGSGNYLSTQVSLGAKTARYELNIAHNGEAAHSDLHGLAIAGDNELVDTHSNLEHLHPHGTSAQLHKCVVGGNGRSVFNGRVLVAQDAQKVAAQQLNNNLLLSVKAKADTKPQLEIFADDVRCTHGATVGQLEPEQFFYLQSRGIPTDEARTLLTYAFAGEVVEKINDVTVREAIRPVVANALNTNAAWFQHRG